MEDKTKNSPLKFLGLTGPQLQLAITGGKVLGSFFGRRRRRRQQRAALAEYEQMRDAYEGLDTSNLYADVQNPYEGMENTMEDLRVNTQQADFMAEQGAQARANILESFRGSAGGSGIAALAQSLANQQTQQAAQISASIGQQEAANQRAAAAQAGRIQELERKGDFAAEQLRLAGEEKGRSLDYRKTGTLFGMAQRRLGVANRALAAAQQQFNKDLGSFMSQGFDYMNTDTSLPNVPGEFEQTVSTSNDYNNDGIDDRFQDAQGNNLYKGPYID